ncbi:hypothetical protein [Bradyrhizobium sp.]|uniref:hypothetical protein n=1 Tax=Bradyrhizobium sp. TaxID=376 RepID=UPI0026162A9C|nr:hypothetical protein [Bradyrhizobium sp.]
MIKAADMMIARRADTKARADFATWKMMAKLNGASALPAEAQAFLASYQALLKEMPEADATDATIQLMYKAYFAEMGGKGTAPDVRAQISEPVTDNVTAFRRPAPQKTKPKTAADTKPKLPVALIFACLVVIYVGFHYYWR